MLRSFSMSLLVFVVLVLLADPSASFGFFGVLKIKTAQSFLSTRHKQLSAYFASPEEPEPKKEEPAAIVEEAEIEDAEVATEVVMEEEEEVEIVEEPDEEDTVTEAITTTESDVGGILEDVDFKERGKEVMDFVLNALNSEIQPGVPDKTIKGAAIAGASLAFLASKGLVVTSAAGLSAAYVAINQGVAGDVIRSVGDKTWEASSSASKIFQSVAGSKITKALENRAGWKESGELTSVLEEAEDAMGIADVAIAQADETLATDETEASEEVDDDDDDEADVEAEEVDDVTLVLEEAESALEAADTAIAQGYGTLADIETTFVEELNGEKDSQEWSDTAEVEPEDTGDEAIIFDEAEKSWEEADAFAEEPAIEDQEDEDDEEWLAAAQLAQDGMDGKIVGFDEAITDDEEKATWDAAGEFAEELSVGALLDNIQGDRNVNEFDDILDQDSSDSDTDAAEDLLPEGDLASLAEAARNAVEKFEDDDFGFDFDDSSADSDLDAASDLLPDGDLEDIALAARQAVEAIEAFGDLDVGATTDQDPFDGFDDSVPQGSEMDWSAFTVPELKAELTKRGLKATGKKADLIATLKAFTEGKLEGGLVTDDDTSDIFFDDDAAAFGDESSSEDDFFDIGDIDLEELGRQARAAVAAFDDDVEPSDEALLQLESEESILLEPKETESKPTETKTTDFSSMTVAQLKVELRQRGLKVSGRKAELIERLESAQ